MVDIALIMMIIIIAIIVGIIVGALYTILSMMWNMKKAKKDYEQGKRLFEIKETSKKDKQKKQKNKFPVPISDEEVRAKGEELEVPKPLKTDTEPPQQKKSIFKKVFKKK